VIFLNLVCFLVGVLVLCREMFLGFIGWLKCVLGY